MNKKFVEQLIKLGNINLVMRKLQERREEILNAISSGKIKPTEELITELAELNIAVGDVPEVSHGS